MKEHGWVHWNYDEPKSGGSGSDAMLSSKYKYGLFTKKPKQTNQEKNDKSKFQN